MLTQTFSTQDIMLLLVWILSIGVVGVLIAILLQVLGLLKEVRQFVQDAQRELRPLMEDLPAITGHVESISAQADRGAVMLGDGLASLKALPKKAKTGVEALFSGLSRAFSEPE